MCALALLGLVAGGGAVAQPIFDDDDDEGIGDDDPAPALTRPVRAAPGTEIGVGLRLRQIAVPRGMIELFVEHAPSGISQTGIGVQVVRRKADFEVSLGIEWERLNPDNGIWVDKGDMIPRDEVDLVEFEGFGWVTIDALFAWHTRLHDKVFLRYGAGLGLGIITGDVLRSDYRCPTADPAIPPCAPQPGGQQRQREEDVPPVFPVINVVLGVQVRPIDKLSINLEGGLRTVPFVGLSADYYF